MADPEDPLNRFRSTSARRVSSSSASEVDPRQQIDDMLDLFDRAFTEKESQGAVSTLEVAREMPPEERELLREILDLVDRLEHGTVMHEKTQELAEFIASTRIRIHALLDGQGVGDMPLVAEKIVEIELEIDFSDLHEFMLNPDIGNWNAGGLQPLVA